MKTWKVVISIVVALAAIAGVVYIIATYGDRIAAWARKLLNRGTIFCKKNSDADIIMADQMDFEG